MTYPPPPGTPDPYSSQPDPTPQDPFAAQPSNPYAQQPVSPPEPPLPPVAQPSSPPYAQQPYSAPPTSGSPYVQQPYGAPYGQQPYGYAMPPQVKTNGMAVAAMVLGIVGVLLCWCYGGGALPGLIGAILGHVSMKQIKERGEEGRGFALTGIITGWASVALALIGVLFFVVLLAADPTFREIFNN
jgi:hypothetical protein